MNKEELKDFLDSKVLQYNRPSFIETDPIQVPHSFSNHPDIEISAFLTATIAWGQRKTIISNAKRWMAMMDNAPGDFIRNFTDKYLERFSCFGHRTFLPLDCKYFMRALHYIYRHHNSIEKIFQEGYNRDKSLKGAIKHFREVFFTLPAPVRTHKHVPDISKGASAKRINLFLRWMVRKDKQGVDFGIWNSIPTSALFLPLDVHTGNVARNLQLLSHKANDWKAVEEVTSSLREFDPMDPIKYDYALFGLGAFENF